MNVLLAILGDAKTAREILVEQSGNLALSRGTGKLTDRPKMKKSELYICPHMARPRRARIIRCREGDEPLTKTEPGGAVAKRVGRGLKNSPRVSGIAYPVASPENGMQACTAKRFGVFALGRKHGVLKTRPATLRFCQDPPNKIFTPQRLNLLPVSPTSRAQPSPR